MMLAHWIGFVLAIPAAVVVLLASWREFAASRTGRSDLGVDSHDA
jgi:hypothetical protein